jgi:tubulin--tyrosine ligase
LNNLSTLLSNLKPEPFDLVISGPNYGRNTGTAFALGSGTVGAALAASLSGTKAISLSYGHFQVATEEMKAAEAKYKETNGDATAKKVPAPTSTTMPPSAPREVVDMAHKLSCRVIEKLYSEWEEDVSIYTINVPLSYLLKDEVVFWTQTWSSKYGQLFKVYDFDEEKNTSKTRLPATAPVPIKELRFSPNMGGMLQPKVMAEGTDIWALMKGYVSVSRLEARYAEAPSSKARQGQFKL